MLLNYISAFFLNDKKHILLNHILKLYTMKKDQQIERLRSRSEKVYADGKLLDYKLFGDKNIRKYYVPEQRYDTDSFNQVQNFLYKQALFGLNIYKPEEVKALAPKERFKIISLQHKAVREINVLKQQRIIKRTNNILALFTKSALAQSIINDDYVNPVLTNRFTFDDLGIKKAQVIERLHKARILQENFYQIKTN